MDLTETSTLNVLNPDDKLMERFQKTLHAHLSRVDNRLAEDILELEASIKQAERELETEGTQLYQTQQEVESQHTTIKQYVETLTKIASLKEKRNRDIENAKDALKKNRWKLKEEETKRDKFSQELANLSDFYNCLSKWEKDLNDYLTISKKMSQQDASKKKTLISKKQRRDFILYRLKEEVWRVEAEIAYLDEQLQIKDREKEDASQMIIDANADLDTMHAEHKDLHDTWRSVVANICKSNNIHDQLDSEQEEIRKMGNTLSLEVQKIKRETDKEMEINEHLTSLSCRIEHDIGIVSRVISMYNDKITDAESELLNLTKINEQTQYDYNVTFIEYQNCLVDEVEANKRFEAAFGKKTNLEDAVFRILEEKVISDKTARYVNELLLNAKNEVLEHEISVARVENVYGNGLLELEKLKSLIENRRLELQELTQKSGEKEKQMNELQKVIDKQGTVIERKQRKLLGINKLIEQTAQNIGGDDLGPQDLKIIGLEKNIQELIQSIQRGQHFWMRQQGFMVSLSQQRESQLRDINLLNKEIMIMEQKNFKLEYALEMLKKEEANINKIIASFEQKTSRMNADLVIQKDLKDELEDKNCVTKTECILSFQELELELIKLQSDLKNLSAEKVALKEELRAAQQESLSWEKKVQLMQETVKTIKEERSAGGIASMKTEIHKMEMRLSYLRRIQEKLIHDMELCVVRRDIIVDKVMGKLKRNPKERHNEKVVIHKRLSNQQVKIKQVLKIMKQTGDAIEELKNKIKDVQSDLTKCQQDLQNLKELMPDIEGEILQLEMLKYHNLHNLVVKQRKVNQLQDIKNGTYKMIYKNECIIEEHLQMEFGYRLYLKDVLEKTAHDFPTLQSSVQKILLTLQVL